MVVNAKPDRTPIPVTPLVIPTYARGNIAATKVAAEANIMKNALLILNLSAVAVLLVATPFFSTSSVIIIWSSTPVPMAARIPAIAGRSIVQCITEATPRMSTSSAKLVIIIGITSIGVLYRMNTITAITRSASIPAMSAPF